MKPAGQQIAKASSVESISYHRSSDSPGAASSAASSNSTRVQNTEATSAPPEVAPPNRGPHDPNEARPSLFQLPKPRVSPELKISRRASLSDLRPQSESWQPSTVSREKEDSVLDTTTLIDDLVAQAEASENSLDSDSVVLTKPFRTKTPHWFSTLSDYFKRTVIKIQSLLQDSQQSFRILRWCAVGVIALLLVWGGSLLFGSEDSSVRIAEEEHRPQAIGQKASYDSGSKKKASAFVATPKAIENNHAAVPTEDSALAKAESASTTIPGGIVATLDGPGQVDPAETRDQNTPANKEEAIVETASLTDPDASEQKTTRSNSRKSARSRRTKRKQPGTSAPSKADHSTPSSKSVVKPPRHSEPDAKNLLAQARKARGLKAYQLAQRSYKLKPTRSSLVIMARAACEMKNTRKAKSAYSKLPFGKQRRSVRNKCRKLGVKVGF